MKIFNVNTANVIEAAKYSIEEIDLYIVDDYQVNDSTRVILAERGYTFMSGVGDVLRVTIIEKEVYQSAVYVLSERKMILLFMGARDYTEDIFENMQSNLSHLATVTDAQLSTIDKKNIAVFPLIPMGISKSDALTLTNRLISELFKTKMYNVLEQEEMTEILTEQGFQQSGCTSSECLVEAGKLLKVEQIVSGKISRIGGYFTIELRMHDIESGQIIALVTQDIAGTVEDVLKTGMRIAVLELKQGK
jgi:TolB-like protein